MAYLVYNIDDTAKRVHIGAAPITIGRQVGNLITLKGDELISRFHAQFERRGDDIWIKDMGSRNGTRVNGKVVVEWKLKPGDVVTIGKTAFTLTGEQQTIPPNTPAAREHQRFEVASEAAGVAPARALAHLAASLPIKAFEQSDIVLMDAKGRVSHDVWRPGDEVPAEAVTLVRLILLVSFRTRASDIHVEPRTDGASVRIRVDGGMVEVCKLKKETFTRLISLIKVLCEIDLSPRNQVQEGSFNARVPDRRVDYRVSFSPSLHGQKLVMRVLDAANAPRYLWDLNLPEPMFRELERSMRRDSGMILVCGPTGSGKTSTLYSVLRTIDATERNVVTIEDPIEIQIENVTQMPVDEDHGNSFPNLLRSVLRQDPDVILVGEIRDQETAKVAMQAAMTGHLVFSTVHSKDTVGSVFRLLDLGLEPFLVASGLQNLLAQRLVRLLCPDCKSPSTPSEDQLREMGGEHAALQKIYVPNGCARCLGTGFAGRRGLFELLSVTDDLRECIQRQNQTDIMTAARKAVFKTLKQSGYSLVAEGMTTFEEVDRVVGG